MKAILQLIEKAGGYRRELYLRVENPPYQPLVIEAIPEPGPLGLRCLSVAHYGEQNGDLMRDPDMVFLFHNVSDGAAAEPVSYRNDYLGISQEIYRYDKTGRRIHVVPTLKQELKEFARAWLATLRDQGFFAATAVREILSP